MPTPSIIILGVYKPDISSEVYQEQWQVTDSDEGSNAHFEDLVLIEAVVDEIDDRFKLIEIGQPQALQDYPNHFQCAYDEALLSADSSKSSKEELTASRVNALFALRFTSTATMRIAHFNGVMERWNVHASNLLQSG
jgi:hypothetical protein